MLLQYDTIVLSPTRLLQRGSPQEWKMNTRKTFLERFSTNSLPIYLYLAVFQWKKSTQRTKSFRTKSSRFQLLFCKLRAAHQKNQRDFFFSFSFPWIWEGRKTHKLERGEERGGELGLGERGNTSEKKTHIMIGVKEGVDSGGCGVHNWIHVSN